MKCKTNQNKKIDNKSHGRDKIFKQGLLPRNPLLDLETGNYDPIAGRCNLSTPLSKGILFSSGAIVNGNT